MNKDRNYSIVYNSRNTLNFVDGRGVTIGPFTAEELKLVIDNLTKKEDFISLKVEYCNPMQKFLNSVC